MLKISAHFKWKLIDGDAFEMSFTDFDSIEAAQDAFDDFWGVTIADCDYFERKIEEVRLVPAGEEEYDS